MTSAGDVVTLSDRFDPIDYSLLIVNPEPWYDDYANTLCTLVLACGYADGPGCSGDGEQACMDAGCCNVLEKK